MAQKQKPGWHNRGYLPHFDANTLVQHVVFRTKASLGSHVLDVARHLDRASARRLIDSELDKSKQGQVFDQPVLADLMQERLRYFDGDRYDLQAWCIMPNHVHVLLVTAPEILLGQIVKTWKSQATRAINAVWDTQGEIFARDYFDRYMRNSTQVSNAIAYIENNPVAGGLCSTPQVWPWSSSAAKCKNWSPTRERMPLFLD